MVTKRRETQRQATRDAILSSAQEIAREQGWQAVTIRRIAEKIDYSAPIIYEYFKNKEAVFAELQQLGFKILQDKMQAAADLSQTDPNPRAALLAIVDAYIRFADECPELDQVMHRLSSAAVPTEDSFANAKDVCDIVESVLHRWAAAEKAQLPDIMQAVEISWALLHGLTSIATLGRFQEDGVQHTKDLAHKAINDLLTAWSQP